MSWRKRIHASEAGHDSTDFIYAYERFA